MLVFEFSNFDVISAHSELLSCFKNGLIGLVGVVIFIGDGGLELVPFVNGTYSINILLFFFFLKNLLIYFFLFKFQI